MDDRYSDRAQRLNRAGAAAIPPPAMTVPLPPLSPGVLLDADAQNALPVRDFEAATWPVKVPKVLRVVRRGNRPARLFIDGEPFGYATRDGISAGPTRKAELPSVTLTLVGYRVEFVDDLDGNGPPLTPDAPKPAPQHYGPAPYRHDMAGGHCGYNGPIMADGARIEQFCICDRSPDVPADVANADDPS